MKSFKDIWEDMMTTADAGFGTGPIIDDEDMRTLSGKPKTAKRKQIKETEDASILPELSGDDVANVQKDAQPLKGAGDCNS